MDWIDVLQKFRIGRVLLGVVVFVAMWWAPGPTLKYFSHRAEQQMKPFMDAYIKSISHAKRTP
jgi:Na+-driven multidrug efflux pump